MARTLIARLFNGLMWGLLTALLCATLPSIAMGPKDPFAPPGAVRVVPPLDVQASAQLAADKGLAGVRLGAQPAALIDGHWVRLGGNVRGARLAQLGPQDVVLQHPNGRRERLPLFAPVPVVEAASAPSDAASAPTPEEK